MTVVVGVVVFVSGLLYRQAGSADGFSYSRYVSQSMQKGLSPLAPEMQEPVSKHQPHPASFTHPLAFVWMVQSTQHSSDSSDSIRSPHVEISSLPRAMHVLEVWHHAQCSLSAAQVPQSVQSEQ